RRLGRTLAAGGCGRFGLAVNALCDGVDAGRTAGTTTPGRLRTTRSRRSAARRLLLASEPARRWTTDLPQAFRRRSDRIRQVDRGCRPPTVPFTRPVPVDAGRPGDASHRRVWPG